jgi:hypothetical protein
MARDRTKRPMRDPKLLRKPLSGCSPRFPICIGRAARDCCTCVTVGEMIEDLERQLREARANLKHWQERSTR